MYNIIDRQVNYTKLQLANEPVFYHIVKLETGFYATFQEDGYPESRLWVASKEEIRERFNIDL
jgi:hypothetical protein